MRAKIKYKTGWRPDLRDVRDFTPYSADINSILKRSNPLTHYRGAAPNEVDLRNWCSPVEDQGYIGSCTANACAGLVEYYHERVYGKHTDISRLFLYKTTRDLMGETGDTGASLRDTMKALVLIGACPESMWPYDEDKFDVEPGSIQYAVAARYRALKYFRVDTVGLYGEQLLEQIKWLLSSGMAMMFGFTMYDSISDDASIPTPTSEDRIAGGHAVLAVGYNDKDENLFIRNSWGAKWGYGGYGFLPYDYVRLGLAQDFWCMAQADFVDTDLFE